MIPVIRRLQKTLFNDSPEAFFSSLDTISPALYHNLVRSHLIINLEYSLLGQQIYKNLSSEQFTNEELLAEQIAAAIFLAKLLERIYQQYLIVPREVMRLKRDQKNYHHVLTELGVALQGSRMQSLGTGISFSQQVRNRTININFYRLLFLRSKRFLDLIAMLDSGAYWYRSTVGIIDKYTDPLLPHLGWFFYLPRLMVNLFLLIKHTIPGPWMTSVEEQSLGWFIRFQAQMQRRWFELANDSAWVIVGFINCFVLFGALAPVAAYLGIAFFGYDVIVAVTRAVIELKRLYVIREQYQIMLASGENKEEIESHLAALQRQINFDLLRLGTHVMSTTSVFLAMCCSAPILAFNPIIPIVGASLLVLICFINFALISVINHYRPKDTIEISPSGVSTLGFFANSRKEMELLKEPAFQEKPEEDCHSTTL